MNISDELTAFLTRFRRVMHASPELAGEEFETSRRIRRELEAAGLKLHAPYLRTDVVADLEGGAPGDASRCVALRADIDGLAIEEKTGLEYASKNPGLMHACGHDGHTAMLLGAALWLARHRELFAGTVRFIFQPGEENLALGAQLVAKGVLRTAPAVRSITAIHAAPGLARGRIFSCAGVAGAGCSHFKVAIVGRGGHSSAPQDCADPVLAMAAMIVELQSVVARRIAPATPAVLSICRVRGGSLPNIIPDRAEFEGTMRALDSGAKLTLHREFERVCTGVAAAHGVRAEIGFSGNYPVLENHEAAFELSREAAGADFELLAAPVMVADDFACYLEQIPGVYVRLGMGEKHPGLHTDTFDFDDELLAVGVKYLVNYAFAALK